MTVEERRKYKRDRLRLIAAGKWVDNKYRAVRDGEVKFFKSRDELANFIGYNKDYLCRLLKTTPEILGWKIERWKWYEHLEEETN